MRWTFLLTFFLFLTLTSAVEAQDEEGGESVSSMEIKTSISQSEPGTSDRSIILKEILVEIDGKTRPGALLRTLRIQEGMAFSDRTEFEEKVVGEIQELRNLRVFVKIDYQIEYVQSDETRIGDNSVTEATLSISATDSWSIFPFIVPRTGSDNSGIQMAVVDKNFLGTLTEMTLSGTFAITWDPVEDRNTISDWETFLLWKGLTFHRWRFSSRLSFGYVTERKSNVSTDYEIVEDLSYYNLVSVTDIRYEFRFAERFYLHLMPTIGGRFNYDVRIDDGSTNYEYFHTGLGISPDFDRVNWMGFLRQGWSAGLLEYVWLTDTGDEFVVRNALTGRFTGHFITGPVNPNFRVLGYLSFDHEASSLGTYLRGVNRYVMYGDRALFLNTGAQFRIFGWDWMDVHLQPFIDMGFAIPQGESMNWNDYFHMGVGSEMLLFFPRLPGIQVRGYFGVDLMVPDWSSSAKWELGASFSLLY